MYGLEVIQVPPNKPSQRMDFDTEVYLNNTGKLEGIINEIYEMNCKGRPVLVGTSSVEESEL